MQTGPNFPRVYLYRRIVCAKLFIDNNYHQAINLDHIADEAFFSKYHFIKIFKTAYNFTPHQYLIRVRVENAKLMLQKGMPVTHVCYAVGFDSPTSFSALFKKLNNISPSIYRHLQIKRAAAMSTAPQKFIPNCFAEQKGWVNNRNFQ